MISGCCFETGINTVHQEPFKFPQQPKILISGDYSCFREGLHLNTCGIYAFSGLYKSESVETPYYIGSAKNIRKRLTNHHIPELKYNYHYNPILKASYNKHGKENFVWFLIEECKEEERFIREQWYLDALQPFADEGRGYNISHDALSGIGKRKHKPETIEKMRNRIISDETRKRISESKKGGRASEETKRKLSLLNSGKNNRMYGVRLPQEIIDRNAKKCSRAFKFIDPSGNIVEGLGLRKFCRDNGLNQGAMCSLKIGKIKSYKGYTRYLEDPESTSEIIAAQKLNKPLTGTEEWTKISEE